MQIYFKKIILHNFGSYSDAEVSLQGRGFCAVTGTNNCASDNAASNGSGKSFLWSAICYALTGETINGLSKNLVNINIDTDEMWVKLIFTCDSVDYTLTRGVRPAKFLNITANGEDKSGKTFTESEDILNQLLPELNKELIASTIIIGQGMPLKFSAHTPKNRKALLEDLTKSDFMFNDIRDRIQSRLSSIQTKLRELEDSKLVYTTKIATAEAAAVQYAQKLAARVKPDFDKMLAEVTEQKTQLTAKKAALEQEKTTTAKRQAELNEQRSNVILSKNNELTEELSAYSENQIGTKTTAANLTAEIAALKKEIASIKAIKTVCPTCGQALLNVKKPSTEEQEKVLADKEESLEIINKRLTEMENKHKSYVKEISDAYADKLNSLALELQEVSKQTTMLESDALKINKDLVPTEAELVRITAEATNFDSVTAELKQQLLENEKNLTELNNALQKVGVEIATVNLHLDVIKKFDSLAKRDFRGYLLINIINYLNKKVKDYCEIVFGTRALEICINDNNLDITYDGKLIDNLSGGEKTRVDLILQLSIRNMLQTFLGFSSNILVLDEITDFLDKQSCAAVFELLNKEVADVESVFIISHHTDELELPIDTQLNIVKDKNGISSVVCAE